VSAGVFKDCHLTCDGCGRRMFGSQVGLGDGMTVADVRKAAKHSGWLVNVISSEVQGDGSVLRGPRLDYCGPCKGARR
jgi:hypothetical protein